MLCLVIQKYPPIMTMKDAAIATLNFTHCACFSNLKYFDLGLSTGHTSSQWCCPDRKTKGDIQEFTLLCTADTQERTGRGHDKGTSHRAKNHISPGEQYFAIFYHNDFQRVAPNFSHFFYLLGKNVFGYHWHKRNKSFSVKNAEITGK